MLDVNVLEIRSGMPIEVEYRDRSSATKTVRVFVTDYEDQYDTKGFDDEGVPKLIEAQEYTEGGGYDDENYITKWVINVPESQITRKHTTKDDEKVKSYQDQYELVDIEII